MTDPAEVGILSAVNCILKKRSVFFAAAPEGQNHRSPRQRLGLSKKSKLCPGGALQSVFKDCESFASQGG